MLCHLNQGLLSSLFSILIALNTPIELNLPACNIVYSSRLDSNNNVVDIVGVSSSSSSTGASNVFSSSSSIAVVPSPPTVILLSTGQSNSQGDGCCFSPSFDVGYNNMLQYYIGDGLGYGSSNVSNKFILTPAREPLFDGGANRANVIGDLVSMGKQYNDQYNPDTILLAQAAVGSTSIAQWTNTYTTRAINTVNSIKTLRPDAIVVMIEWTQGEANAGSNPTDYQNELITNLLRLRSETASPTTPIVLGSMVPEWATSHTDEQAIYNVHRNIPNLVPYTAFRNAPMGLTDCYEGIHYSATGQRLRGKLSLQGFVDAQLNTVAGRIPNHPINLVVSLNNNNLIQLQWNAAPVNPTAPVDNYVVAYKLYNVEMTCVDQDASLPIRILTNNIGSTSYTFSSNVLQAGMRYQFDVYAISGSQQSSGYWASAVFATTAPSTPIVPETITLPSSSPVPFILIPSQTSVTNIIDNWTYNDGSIGYAVDSDRGNVVNMKGTSFYTPYVIPGDYTICLWFSVTATHNYNWVFASAAVNSVNDASWNVGVSSNGVLFQNIVNNVATSSFSSLSYTIPSFAINKWYHVCYRYTYNTGNSVIYLNGLSVASSTIANTVWQPQHANIQFGSGYAVAYPIFTLLQGFAVWSTSITDQHVRYVYQQQRIRNNVNLLSYYTSGSSTARSSSSSTGLSSGFSSSSSSLASDPRSISGYLIPSSLVYFPSNWMSGWNSVISQSNTRLVRIAVLGDGFVAGNGASNQIPNSAGKTISALLANKFQTRSINGGDGGSGYVSPTSNVLYSTNTAYSSSVLPVSVNGFTPNIYSVGSPSSMFYQSGTIGDTLTFYARGTTITIFYFGGASCSVSIDGVSQTSIPADSVTVVLSRSYTVSQGEHSVLITHTGAGNAFIVGVAATSSSGIVVDNYSVPDVVLYNIIHTPQNNGNVFVNSGGGANGNTADLVIMAFGIMDIDYNSQHYYYYASDFVASYTSAIDAYQTAGVNRLMIVMPNVGNGPNTAEFNNYRSSVRSLAISRNVAYIDLNNVTNSAYSALCTAGFFCRTSSPQATNCPFPGDSSTSIANCNAYYPSDKGYYNIVEQLYSYLSSS
jgi:hypothetical protein